MRSPANWPEVQIATQAVLVPTLMPFYPYLHSGLLVLEFIHTTFLHLVVQQPSYSRMKEACRTMWKAQQMQRGEYKPIHL